MFDREKLTEILRQHQIWLEGKDGECASLIEADLSGMSLEGVVLRHANLYGARLNGSTLTNADLSGAILEKAEMRNACCNGVDFSGARLSEACFIRANLRKANFHKAYLNAAILDSAEIHEACFTGADLQDAGFVVAGYVGSRGDITYYHVKNDLVRCGCFSGTLPEFEASVRERHSDGRHLEEYEAVISFLRRVSTAWKQ